MMNKDERLQVLSLTDIPHLKVHGRTTGELAPLTLFWTGSGIELHAKGSELWVEVESNYDIYEPWISVMVNGAVTSRQMLTAGRRWVCIFRGMSGEGVKKVRIVRDTQAMSGDLSCCLQIHAVKSDGEFVPVREGRCRIEFIGDSITSGEGAIGAKEETAWIPMWFSAIDNYTAMTAAALDADYQVVSQSGWGVLTGWDNNPHAAIPSCYEQVCGVLTGERNERLGANSVHDFDSWQPDVIVVNLGTNDGGAFHSPAWTDPKTGRTHKQRLCEDGSYHREDLQAFEHAAVAFLAMLRRHNPAAHLVWAYGMLGIPMMPAIRRAVSTYMERTGDGGVSVVELPAMTDQAVGARSHPGKLAHERAAEVLSAYIAAIVQYE